MNIELTNKSTFKTTRIKLSAYFSLCQQREQRSCNRLSNEENFIVTVKETVNCVSYLKHMQLLGGGGGVDPCGIPALIFFEVETLSLYTLSLYTDLFSVLHINFTQIHCSSRKIIHL